MAHERISADPKVMTGKPVIRGTRIKVELLLRLMGGGHTIEELLTEYTHIAREDINAALTCVADFVPGAKTESYDWGEDWTEIPITQKQSGMK